MYAKMDGIEKRIIFSTPVLSNNATNEIYKVGQK